MERLITTVAARFGFDCERWPMDRLRRYAKRHEALYLEELAQGLMTSDQRLAMAKKTLEAGLGRS